MSLLFPKGDVFGGVVFPASMFPEAPKVYLVQRPGTPEKISYISQVILARKSHSRLRGWLTHPRRWIYVSSYLAPMLYKTVKPPGLLLPKWEWLRGSQIGREELGARVDHMEQKLNAESFLSSESAEAK